MSHLRCIVVQSIDVDHDRVHGILQLLGRIRNQSQNRLVIVGAIEAEVHIQDHDQDHHLAQTTDATTVNKQNPNVTHEAVLVRQPQHVITQATINPQPIVVVA